MTNIISGVDGPMIGEPGEIIAANVSEYQIKPRVIELLAPFGDRVVVRPDSAEEMIGSFYVPDTAQERPARGTVVAVGPGIRLDDGSVLPMTAKVGDVVIYGHFTGAEAVHNGEAVLILREEDLFSKVILA